MSNHLPVDHSDTPIRLFKSDFLEAFTHIHPAVIFIVWVPVVGFFIFNGLAAASMRFTASLPSGILLGLFIWTLMEYLLHRFVFHYEARTAFQQKIFFLFHGVHHAQPQCRTRLVMPLPVSIPLAAIFYGIFYVLFVVLFNLPSLLFPVLAGFLIGYIAYDFTHYATHHFPMRGGYLKYIKRHHMRHHYKTPNQRFGVSSPLWDFVFGTMPK